MLSCSYSEVFLFFFDCPLFPVKRLHFCSMRDEFTLLTVIETMDCFTTIWGWGRAEGGFTFEPLLCLSVVY